MPLVTAISVKNLRSLGSTGFVELKPITILVGKNSAGKSTFARILPLLKQSAERRKQAPILWYGRLVDFGSFEEAVSSFAVPPDRTVEIGLRLSVPSPLQFGRRYYNQRGRPEPSAGASIDVTIRLSANAEARTQLNEVNLNVFGTIVNLEFQTTGLTDIKVDNRSLLKEATNGGSLEIAATIGALLPQIRGISQQRQSDEAPPRQNSRIASTFIHQSVRAFVHGNTADETIAEIADRIPLTSFETFFQTLLEIPNTPESWHTGLNAWGSTGGAVRRLHLATILHHLDELLGFLDDEIADYCMGISYLEPLRATAQRYYRREEIATEELDPKGTNTPFFFQGLTLSKRNALNEWLAENLGFKINVRDRGGHLSLEIGDISGDAPNRNMADVGLGYAQVIPVALQLWAALNVRHARGLNSRLDVWRRTGRPGNAGRVVVVEQPELHLHPAFQAKLADLFAGAVRLSLSPTESSPQLLPRPFIVAETHSPSLINRLGQLIEAGRLRTEDVQVIVFEPSITNQFESTLRIASFDEKGVLTNWPFGFFET